MEGAAQGQGGISGGAKLTAIAIGFVMVGLVAFAAGVFVGHGNVLGDLDRTKAASQNLLVNLLVKLADLSDEKAPKIADATVSSALDVVGDIFRNASIRTAQGLQNGNDYLCDNLRWSTNFSQARFGTNYSAICGGFHQVVDRSTGPIPDFETAFDDLVWTLVELDNAIEHDP